MKTYTLGVRLKEEMRIALEKAAEDDTRSTSSMVEKIIKDWLQEKGYLPRAPQ